ncbi:MAG: TIR domain-containing protein [Novosphingobium sp.]|uniref:TIR domain-containing protein n=1 Tax=Novosphingobium sp. TaxID=1874826 RepID=UPI0032B72022
MANSLLGGLYIKSAPKRKVFISYHHGGDQAYYNALSEHLGTRLDLITDRSLERARDSDDPTYIMRYIRENHLAGASTLIVLCGAQTPVRKYVDWEILAGLGQRMALVGVGLPTIKRFDNGGTDKPPRLQDNIDSGYAVWRMWSDFLTDPVALIEDGNSRSKSLIVNGRQRRIRNG